MSSACLSRVALSSAGISACEASVKKNGTGDEWRYVVYEGMTVGRWRVVINSYDNDPNSCLDLGVAESAGGASDANTFDWETATFLLRFDWSSKKLWIQAFSGNAELDSDGSVCEDDVETALEM